MYTTIIWATDGSAGADAALAEARRLSELSDGHIVAVHCDQRLSGRLGAWAALANEEDLLLTIAHHVEDLQEDGVPIELVIRRSHQEAADTVAAVATELDADVIVCGTHGRGALAGAFLGSFTHRLLHIAPCPVLAVRQSEVESSTEHEDATKVRVHA